MEIMTMNQRLRSIRRAKGLTLEELAEITGTQGSYLGRIERGERGLSPKMAQRLAPALDVDAEFLLLGHQRVLLPIPPANGEAPAGTSQSGGTVMDREFIQTVAEYVLHTYAEEYGNAIPRAEVEEIAKSVAVFCWAYRFPESRQDIQHMRDAIKNAVSFHREMQPRDASGA